MSYLFIAVVRKILEFKRSAAVELPFPFANFLPDQNDRILMVLDELVADLESGKDRTV